MFAESKKSKNYIFDSFLYIYYLFFTLMTHVLPAIIPHNKTHFFDEVKIVADFASLIQVDISDGIFTPFKTWPYNDRDLEFFEALKKQDLGWPHWENVDIELHLMTKNPEETLLEWIHTGITSVVAHIEATETFQTVVDICRTHDVMIGVAFKPSTDISRIGSVAPHVDFIQVMGSDMLGKHGEELDLRVVEKIQTLRALYPQSIIAVDIGVTEETARELVHAGADKLVVGSAILEARNPSGVFRKLQSLG